LRCAAASEGVLAWRRTARARAPPAGRPISTECFARASRGRHRRAWSTETTSPPPVLFRAVRSFSLAGWVPARQTSSLRLRRRPLAFGVDVCAAVLNPPPHATWPSARRRLAAVLPNSTLFLQEALAWQTDARPTQFVDTATPVRLGSLTAALARQAYSGCRGSPQPRRQCPSLQPQGAL